MTGRFSSNAVRRNRPAAAVVAAALSLLLSACGGSGGSGGPTSSLSVAPPPPPPPTVSWNFVVIYTDDQRRDSLPDLPLLEEKVFSSGVRFSNAYVPTPSCTTSRASTFSGGFFAQNTGIKENNRGPNGNLSGFDDTATLATIMQSAGYQTMFVGKYLNDYPQVAPYVPPGWDRFVGRASHATSANWSNFQYATGSTDSNGSATGTMSRTNGVYNIEFESNEVINFLDTADPNQPFLVIMSTTPPHAPATPYPGEEGLFWDFELDPTRVETDLSDKPEWVRNYAGLVNDIEFVRDQRASLRAIDRAVAAIVDKVEAMGKLEETVFIFTSDNGYSWGEHSAWGKGNPYEESIGVPLVISIPGIAPREDDSLVYATLDSAATIFDLAGVEAPSDGQSLLPLLQNPDLNFRDQIFFESYGGWIGGYGAWTAVRDRQWKYIEHGNGEHELYNLVDDPLERDSQHENPDVDAIEAPLAEGIAAFQGIMVKPMHYVSVGRVSREFHQELAVLGGDGPYLWSIYSGELPDGLMLEPDTGVISGIPTVAGEYILRYKVVGTKIARHRGDAQQHVSRKQKISIRP